jgi:uncharacterized protein with PQ loop repeat
MEPLALLAALWGLVMAVSPALQIRRIVERRSAADVSISYLAVLQVGFSLWIAYGISLGNVALIVPNGAAFAVGAVTMFVSWRFRLRAAR